MQPNDSNSAPEGLGERTNSHGQQLPHSNGPGHPLPPHTQQHGATDDSATSLPRPRFPPLLPYRGPSLDAWMRAHLPPGAGVTLATLPHPPGVGAPAPLYPTSWDFSPEGDDYPPAPANLPVNLEPNEVMLDEMDKVDAYADEPLLFAPPATLGSVVQPGSGSGMGGLGEPGPVSAGAWAGRGGAEPIWTLTDQPGIDLLASGPILALAGQLPYTLFVILFGVGERDTEGIYSLRALKPDGMSHETIIAFECEEDAQRYAALLEASMDHLPNVCTITPKELTSFCQNHGYSCRLEPLGSLLIPPDFCVYDTDWERSLRLRAGKFTVLGEEPAGGASAGGGGSAVQAHMEPAAGGTTSTTAKSTQQLPPGNLRPAKPGASHSNLARYTAFGGQQLETIRARLEALLPRDAA